MDKYLQIVSISLSQDTAYRVNFFMGRMRGLLQVFLMFFLWDAVFREGDTIFGYTRASILTYVFGVYVIKSIVFSVRSNEVAGEISRGDLTSYLLKPMGYFKYWFTRDISIKVLNICFTIIEVAILYYFLRPPLTLPDFNIFLFLFFVSVGLSIIMYFLLLMIFCMLPFWYPEGAWGFTFLLLIFIEFLGGGVFPLDIFPAQFLRIVHFTPFPYLLFVPLQIYLGKVNFDQTLAYIAVFFVWIVLLTVISKFMWKMGLRAYRAEGR